MERIILTTVWITVGCLSFTGCSLRDHAEADPAVPVSARVVEDAYLPAQGAVSSDSVESGQTDPGCAAAFDGDLNTRWNTRSPGATHQLTLDLGQEAVLSSIAVNWAWGFPARCSVQVSSDAHPYKKTFKEVALRERIDGGREVLRVNPPVRARFVKLEMEGENRPGWGFSIKEVELYGPAAENLNARPLSEARPLLARQLPQMRLVARERPLGSVNARRIGEFHNGVCLVSPSDQSLAHKKSDRELRNLKEMGVNTVALVITWYQDNEEATNISPHHAGRYSVNDDALIHAINEAHRNGLRVMLKPHVDLMNGAFRGNITPTKAWFASYREFILYYAKIAELYGVSLFCVGTELENASFEGWAKEWKQLITEIRECYEGKLTYAANWTEYTSVSFWDHVDLIGINAYFPVTDQNNPSSQAMNQGWEKIASKLAGWRNERGISQPILFTELGYQSVDGSNMTPWRTRSNVADEEEQAMAVDAMFQAMRGKPWFMGVYWWNCYPSETPRPLDFTFKGKRAEKVLRKWFKETKEL